MTNFNKASFVLTIFVASSIFLLMPQNVTAQQPLLDPSVLSKGLKMFRGSGVKFITTGLPPLQYLQQASYEYLLGEKLELQNKILAEQNDTAKLSLQAQKDQLEVQIKMLNTTLMQYELNKNIFEYTKLKDESVLRKTEYSFKPGKMVIVVADFSGGIKGEGREIANEIYSSLKELSETCGLDFEILNGEIKNNVEIRSEEIAREVGVGFPIGTYYAVIWGTMSPNTVGEFRPNITFCAKNSEGRGVTTSYNLLLESKALPKKNDDDSETRAKYKNLVAFSCGAIPSFYSFYEFTCERVPDFEKLYKYLGINKEANTETAELKKKIAICRKWPEIRKTINLPLKENFEYLTRLTSVEKEPAYPKSVLNKKDRTVMTLVTERVNPSKPEIFNDKALGNYICYMDETEVTWISFANRYNHLSLKEKDNNPLNRYVNFIPFREFLKLGNNSTPFGNHMDFIKGQPEFAVSYISYTGADIYCHSAGKSLPRKVEWDKAAEGAKSVPNKNQFPNLRVKNHNLDVSNVGCFDMLGNVDEWAGEEIDNKNQFTIFSSDKVRLQPANTKDGNIGFRGVVRIPIGIYEDMPEPLIEFQEPLVVGEPTKKMNWTLVVISGAGIIGILICIKMWLRHRILVQNLPPQP